MSTFQIAVSVCLLTFFLITGCNDLTQSSSQSLNSQIVKEVHDADNQMAKKQAEQDNTAGMSTTVEIIKQESRDAQAESEADQTSAAPNAVVGEVAQVEKTADKKSQAMPQTSSSDEPAASTESVK